MTETFTTTYSMSEVQRVWQLSLIRSVGWLLAVVIVAGWASTMFDVSIVAAALRLSIVLALEPLYVVAVLFR